MSRKAGGQLVQLSFIFTVKIRIRAVGTVSVAEFKFDRVEPRRLDMNGDIELIIALVALGGITLAVSLRVRIEDLFAVFAYLRINIFYLIKADKIGICTAPIAEMRHDKSASDRVGINFLALSESFIRDERGELFPVFFTVGKLLSDLLDRRIAAVVEKRRKFFRAIFAEIAVLQFTVAQKSDLFTAYIAVFFVKQTHDRILRSVFRLPSERNRVYSVGHAEKMFSTVIASAFGYSLHFPVFLSARVSLRNRFIRQKIYLFIIIIKEIPKKRIPRTGTFIRRVPVYVGDLFREFIYGAQ